MYKAKGFEMTQFLEGFDIVFENKVVAAIEVLRSKLGDEVMNGRNDSEFRVLLPDIQEAVAAEVEKRMKAVQLPGPEGWTVGKYFYENQWKFCFRRNSAE